MTVKRFATGDQVKIARGDLARELQNR
jgi:hypothetical protein